MVKQLYNYTKVSEIIDSQNILNYKLSKDLYRKIIDYFEIDLYSTDDRHKYLDEDGLNKIIELINNVIKYSKHYVEEKFNIVESTFYSICRCLNIELIYLKPRYYIHKNDYAKIEEFIKCHSDAEERKRYLRESSFEKLYGTKNYLCTKEFKEKATKTKIEKYGKEYNKVIKKLSSEELIKKYGTDNINSLDCIKEKKKKNSIEKWGTESPNQSNVVKKNQLNGRYRKNNGKYASEESRNRAKETCLKNYGVEYGVLNNGTWIYNNIKFQSKNELYLYVWLKDKGIEFKHQIRKELYYDDNGTTREFIVDFKIGNQYIEIKGNQFFDDDGNAYIPWEKSKDTDRYKKALCRWENKLKFIKSRKDITLIKSSQLEKNGCLEFIVEYFNDNYFIKNKKIYRKILD